MTAEARVLPFRPLPHFDGPPDTLMTLLEACEGLPDVTVARLVDHYFGPQLAAWQAEADAAARLAFEQRYADGHRASDLRACANPRCLRCGDQTDPDQPNDEPTWPPPLIEGDPQPLPGFEGVPEKPAERRYPG